MVSVEQRHAFSWTRGQTVLTLLRRIAEKKKYKGEAIPKGDFGGYGHYSELPPVSYCKYGANAQPAAQVMWKSTTRVGIACAKSKKGSWYTVARYSPPGNFVGQKPY